VCFTVSIPTCSLQRSGKKIMKIGEVFGDIFHVIEEAAPLVTPALGVYGSLLTSLIPLAEDILGPKTGVTKKQAVLSAVSDFLNVFHTSKNIAPIAGATDAISKDIDSVVAIFNQAGLLTTVK
jgi:hypothetical protein